MGSALSIGGRAVRAGTSACAAGVLTGAGAGPDRGDAATDMALAGGVDVATGGGGAIVGGATMPPAGGAASWPPQPTSASSASNKRRRRRWYRAIERR